MECFITLNNMKDVVKNIERHADSYKELTEKYKSFYDIYILQEKIFADDSKYVDTFKSITDAAKKYNEAFTSGDESKIKEAANEYAKFQYLNSSRIPACLDGISFSSFGIIFSGTYSQNCQIFVMKKER